jgi:Zinc finger, ZZ type
LNRRLSPYSDQPHFHFFFDCCNSAPISKVIGYLPKNIPRILINRTIAHPPEQIDEEEDESDGDDEDSEFREDYVFDAYLLGFCDDVTRALGKKLFSESDNSSSGPANDMQMEEGELLASILQDSEVDSATAYSADDWAAVAVPTERVFLFPGAEAPSGMSEEVPFREIAHCDGCSKEIEGTIQKCVVCFDYDLCQVCFPVLSKTHYDGKHHFAAEAVST